MNTTKVIIFNAPPDCGKDFLSDYLVADMGAKKNDLRHPEADVHLRN